VTDAAAIRISVIVCTRDRASALDKALHSIDHAAKAVPGASIEVILVNNGSRDNTSAIAANWAATTPLASTIIDHEQPGLAGARNVGLAASTGDIIVFTDDDCCLSPTYFPEMLAHYDANPGPVVLGGRVELGDPSDLPLSIKTIDHGSDLAGDIHPGAFLLGANMTMRRSVVEMVGPFDVRFGAGALFRSGEDTEYLHRAMLAGIPVKYVPDMTVHHFHGRKAVSDIRNLHQGYDFGTGAIYAKYWRKSPSLLRHFYWMARNGLREFVGGPRFNESLGISHRDVALSNARGFLAFFLISIGEAWRGSRKSR
jgi:glycosyltransferase involved in cell wall biosynthesis